MAHYTDEFIARLQLVWGPGFLSPGGPQEVGEIVKRLGLGDRRVLDIGCGTGGPAIVLARDFGAEKIAPFAAQWEKDGGIPRSVLEEAAARIATDVGAVNQNACASCRLVYVMCGTDDDGIATLSKLGKLVYEKMMGLPPDLSTKPKSYDPSLKADVDALRLMDDWYEVIGGEDGEGAVIVSHTPEAVDFADALDDRTVNLIPVDTMDEILDAVDAYTQTVGVFPHELIGELRHKMSLHGAQRFVSLGYAFNGPGVIGPQDAIEPVRRMCKWIVVETPGEQSVPLWELQEGELALSP